MAIKTLISNKTDDLGKSNNIICPACNKETQMRIFSNYDLDNLIGRLLSEDKELNFAVCPLCETVFSINMTSYGVQNAPLKPYHLTVLHKGSHE